MELPGSGIALCGKRSSERMPVPGPNSIVFAANVTGTITLQTGLGELVINDSTTINGPGARIMAVSGNEAHRVLNFSAGKSTVSGLTIRDGWNAGSSGGVTRIGWWNLQSSYSDT